MIKTAISDLGLAPLAVIGLVVFVAVFLGVVAWVLTRSRRQVDRWASIPLSDEPVDPRDAPTTGQRRSGGPSTDAGPNPSL